MSGTESATYSHHFGIELYEGLLYSHHFPPHFHDSFTVILVEEGAMDYSFAETQLSVGCGQAFVINPFEAHSNVPGIYGCRYKAMFIPAGFFRSADGQLPYFPKHCTGHGLYGMLLGLYSRIRTICSEPERDSLVDELRTLLLKSLSPSAGRVHRDARLLPAFEFINANLDEKLTVALIAQQCFMSPFHFQRVFRRSVGLTVVAYIQQQRTELGKQLLRQGEPAAHAAMKTGYFDRGYFHKAFRKMWVVKPSHFHE